MLQRNKHNKFLKNLDNLTKHVIPYNVNIYSGYVAIAVTILVNIS